MKLVAKTNRTKQEEKMLLWLEVKTNRKTKIIKKNKAWRSDVNRIDLALVPKYKQTIIVSDD